MSNFTLKRVIVLFRRATAGREDKTLHKGDVEPIARRGRKYLDAVVVLITLEGMVNAFMSFGNASELARRIEKITGATFFPENPDVDLRDYTWYLPAGRFQY